MTDRRSFFKQVVAGLAACVLVPSCLKSGTRKRREPSQEEITRLVRNAREQARLDDPEEWERRQRIWNRKIRMTPCDPNDWELSPRGLEYWTT